MLIEQLNVVRTRRKGAKWYCAFKKLRFQKEICTKKWIAEINTESWYCERSRLWTFCFTVVFCWRWRIPVKSLVKPTFDQFFQYGVNCSVTTWIYNTHISTAINSLLLKRVVELPKHRRWYCSSSSSKETVVISCQWFMWWWKTWNGLVTIGTNDSHDISKRAPCHTPVSIKDVARRIVKHDNLSSRKASIEAFEKIQR